MSEKSNFSKLSKNRQELIKRLVDEMYTDPNANVESLFERINYVSKGDADPGNPRTLRLEAEATAKQKK